MSANEKCPRCGEWGEHDCQPYEPIVTALRDIVEELKALNRTLSDIFNIYEVRK